MLLKEKISQYGFKDGMGIYSDSELIAIMTGVTESLAHQINMNDPISTMTSVRGIGKKKAMIMEAINEFARRKYERVNDNITAIMCPEDAYLYVKDKLQFEHKEHFGVILLNTKNNIIGYHDVSIGDLDFSIVHPREVMFEAIKAHASTIILVHNHPSGDPSPSDEDIDVTSTLIKAGRLLKIPVLDHIIVGRERFISMKKSTILSFG